MLDAPVSGGVLAADAGTLTFMVWFHLSTNPFSLSPFKVPVLVVMCHLLALICEKRAFDSIIAHRILENTNCRLNYFLLLIQFMERILYAIQVGGSEEAYLAAKPLFLLMGKNTIYCGGTGTGSVRSQNTIFNIRIAFLLISR